MRKIALVLLLAFASVSAVINTSTAASVAEPAVPDIPVAPVRTASVFTFHLENDFFGGNDRHYTNGAKLSWLSGDLNTWGQTGWRQTMVEALPFVNRPDAQKNLGFALGQNMYTPEHDELHVPDPADRPYAGWTYLEFNFISKTPRVMDSLSFQIGVIGRHSYAQETQHLVHSWLNDRQARGWAFQLKDEVAGNIIYERRWRLYARGLSEAVGFDLVPHAGASLGTVQTYANLGVTARLGFHLPNDFGVEPIAGGAATNSPLDRRDSLLGSHRPNSLFVFGGVDGRAVARDIFLDGNTWRDSPSVDKEPLVGDSYWGIGLVLRQWQITYTYVVRAKEFKAQREVNQFGSIAISRAF